MILVFPKVRAQNVILSSIFLPVDTRKNVEGFLAPYFVLYFIIYIVGIINHSVVRIFSPMMFILKNVYMKHIATRTHSLHLY